VTSQPFLRNLTDAQDPAQATSLPRDTIPVGSAVYFGWHGFDKDWQSQISGYRYKLVESDYQVGDSLTKQTSYGTACRQPDGQWKIVS
jgi:surface antigen